MQPVTIYRVDDTRYMTKGNVFPKNADCITLTILPKEEVEKIMEATIEDVQTILSAYIP